MIPRLGDGNLDTIYPNVRAWGLEKDSPSRGR